MMDLIGSFTSVEVQMAIIDAAMYFGLIVIAAMSLNFQYGNAGVPNMASALSASFGGFAVSAIVARLVYWVGIQAGLEILPLGNSTDWINHNNCFNVDVMNAFIETHAAFGISVFILSLALGFAAGWALGYLISIPAFRLKFTPLIIALVMLEDVTNMFARLIIPIFGGSQGMFVPNLFAWYSGNRTLPLTVITLTMGIIIYFILGRMLNSPFGRLMSLVRGNHLSYDGLGEDVTELRRKVLMFGAYR